MGDARATHVEGGAVAAPSLAATPTRLGVAYQHVGETHFVLFDLGLTRVGDVVTAMPFLARTAVAFAGAAATLFWADTRSAKTRLTVAT